ncbi:MAG: arabinofuranosyltransferase [Promethearchaeota archaeon]
MTIILILTLSFFFVFLVFNQTDSKESIFKVNYKRNIILFSIFNFAGYLFLFYNTHWGYNGLLADNIYRTAFITKMYYSGYPQDFAYKGLSAFYAPLYWYCLALIAIIFQIPPYKMIRIGMLITVYVIPIVLFNLWKKIYEQKIAFTITIISTIYLLSPYIIDHIVSALIFIPFFLYYFENYKNKAFTKFDYIKGGIIGAISFCTYFLYFLIIPIYYLIQLIQDKDELRKKFKHLNYLTISLLVFSSWYWGPLLKDIILLGFESHQNRYFSMEILTYPLLGYLGLSVWSISHALGIVYIIKKYKKSIDLKILGNLLIAVHIIFLIGLIAVIIKFPIMHYRFMTLSTYILMVSSSIFYVKFFLFLAENEILKNTNVKINLYQIEIFLLTVIFITQNTSNWYYLTQTSGYEAAQGGNSMDEQRKIFEKLDYEDKVFLTNEWKITMYLPIYLFLLPNPYYNHPSALYNQRIEFLVELSECDSSKEFYDKIMNNKFGPIDYFYLELKDNNTKLVLEVAVENFPEGRDYYEIHFDIGLFKDDRYFEEIQINDVLIYRTKY